jgi:hypothetical protein
MMTLTGQALEMRKSQKSSQEKEKRDVEESSIFALNAFRSQNYGEL